MMLRNFTKLRFNLDLSRLAVVFISPRFWNQFCPKEGFKEFQTKTSVASRRNWLCIISKAKSPPSTNSLLLFSVSSIQRIYLTLPSTLFRKGTLFFEAILFIYSFTCSSTIGDINPICTKII